jgi:hypothetical protein
MLLKSFMVPGSAVAIIKDGQVVYKKGYGFADVAKQKPVNLDTGFNIGSILKTVAAWGVMRLVITTNGSNGHNVHRNITCHWKQWTTGIKAESNCISKNPISFVVGKAIMSGP